MDIRATIWDLGGVIVRTEDKTSRTALGRRFGMSYQEMDDFVFGSETAAQATVGEIPVEQHWEAICRRLNLPVTEMDAVQAGFWGGDQVDRELVAYIDALRPRYKTALLSNAWSDLREYAVNQWQIAGAFDELIISAEVKLAKPDPRIFHLAVQRLGVQPGESVFIDDFLINVEAARAAGLHSIHFRSSLQVRADLELLLAGATGTSET